MQNSYTKTSFNFRDIQNQIDQIQCLIKVEFESNHSRTDLTHLKTYTIDQQSSYELDDAISIDKSGIWIHIADPTSFIPVDSPIDIEAKARSASSYLSNGTIPMLPEVLVCKLFSLTTKYKTPALSACIQLDPSGEITKSHIMLSWIKLKYRLFLI